MRFYRTYIFKGIEYEASVEADNELDAETEFFYFEQDKCSGDEMEEFEWSSSIYTGKER